MKVRWQNRTCCLSSEPNALSVSDRRAKTSQSKTARSVHGSSDHRSDRCCLSSARILFSRPPPSPTPQSPPTICNRQTLHPDEGGLAPPGSTSTSSVSPSTRASPQIRLAVQQLVVEVRPPARSRCHCPRRLLATLSWCSFQRQIRRRLRCDIRRLGASDRAWDQAVRFRTARPREILPGAVRGSDTGLGLSSWTYDRSNIRLASWHKSFSSLSLWSVISTQPRSKPPRLRSMLA